MLLGEDVEVFCFCYDVYLGFFIHSDFTDSIFRPGILVMFLFEGADEVEEVVLFFGGVFIDVDGVLFLFCKVVVYCFCGQR